MGEIEGGVVTTRYAAFSQTRLRVDALISVSNNATFRQLQSIDYQAAGMENAQRDQHEATE